jgi:hypothetical protein
MSMVGCPCFDSKFAFDIEDELEFEHVYLYKN